LSLNDTGWSGSGSDEAIVAALLRGASYEHAADEAGCSRSTVVRRMADPAFRARLDGLRREMLARVADTLAAHALAAVETLGAIATDERAAPAARSNAARAILDAAVRFHDAADLAARVAGIENALEMRRLTR
jgi:hypothetical protein